MDKQGPKCNCAVTQQLDLLSPSSSSSTEPSSGGLCAGLSKALTREAAWGHFVSFQFGFASLWRAVLVWTVGVVGWVGEGTLTPVVVGSKGGLVGVMDLGTVRKCWSALEWHGAWGEREGDVGHRVQTCLSAAFTTDRPIAKSAAAWVMTAYLGDLLCPLPLKHTFYTSSHDSDINVLRWKHHWHFW